MDEKLGVIISALDTAAGMLIVTAMKDQTVRKAMELVSQASFDLGNVIDMSEVEPDLKRWDKAISHAREMLEVYKTIPMGIFGATMITSDIARYERGERSIDLLESLEEIK